MIHQDPATGDAESVSASIINAPDSAGVDAADPLRVRRRSVTVVRRQHGLGRRSMVHRTEQRLLRGRFTVADRLAAQRARRRRPWGLQLTGLGTTLELGKRVAAFVNGAFASVRKFAERMAALVSGAFASVRKFAERMVSIVKPPVFQAFRRMRERIDGMFGFDAAKLQRIVEPIFGFSRIMSWFSDLVRPLTDAVTTFIRSAPDLAKWAGRLAIRLLFFAACKVRQAILRGDDGEEAVKEFMTEFLDLFPTSTRVEAATAALLEDEWMTLDSDVVLRHRLRSRIRVLHRSFRFTTETKLNRRPIVSLDRCIHTANPEDTVLTLAATIPDPVSVEDLVINRLDGGHPAIKRALGHLTFDELRVAQSYVTDEGMTWERAANAAGLPASYGERVRRKLRRIGNEMTRRREIAALATC